MDPCECVWDHENAMRRLLNLLRNTQSVCTDTECFEEGTPGAVSGCENALILSLIMTVSLFLYFFRPRTERTLEDNKPVHQDTNGAPPNPPPTAM
ncbi:hypothetical protein WA026_007168 [Henosepilachna vigintioctopunctata]|uniref:Small integral membrane protein 14 n=1 Tax=Henosepilachna vigintioctopunctata TaxID=420089 RepID=A0AAW1V9Q9_9CUCU